MNATEAPEQTSFGVYSALSEDDIGLVEEMCIDVLELKVCTILGRSHESSPDLIQVTPLDPAGTCDVLLRLEVAPSDIGRIIGKRPKPRPGESQKDAESRRTINRLRRDLAQVGHNLGNLRVKIYFPQMSAPLVKSEI